MHTAVAEVQEGCLSACAESSEHDIAHLADDYRRWQSDDQRENEVSSGNPAVDRPTVIYLDPRTLTRDCVGRCLQANLDKLQVRLHARPDTIVGKADDLNAVRAVIINTGPEPMASSATTTLLAKVGEVLPGKPIVVFSDHDDAGSIFKAFELGARGYIPTSLATLVAVEAIRLVCAGGTFAPTTAFLSPTLHNGGAGNLPPAIGEPVSRRFTLRQTEILERLQRGMTNKLIAHELDMCESTVKVHIHNIMKKLKATNRTQIVCLTRDMVPLRNLPAG
jgi:DNA-binding NarL/FixJ family response regulator